MARAVAHGQLQPLPRSTRPERITDQREAPAWQFVIDNDAHGSDVQRPAQHPAVAASAGCVCSAAAPACCPHAAGRAQDWWADPGRRAGFRTVGNHSWAKVTDTFESQAAPGLSHQVGSSFFVSFVDPGPLPQGMPPPMEAIFHFVAPATGAFNFAITAVDAHAYPLSDAAIVCVREAAALPGRTGAPCSGPCFARGTVDQRGGSLRDGRWQRALSGVALAQNVSYEFSMRWDPAHGGYVAADALLVESQRLYNGGGERIGSDVVLGPMDSRIFIKRPSI